MRERVAIVLVALLVALAAAEGALRLVPQAWVIPYPPLCYRPDLFERWDPYGYRLHPSRSLRDVYPFPDGRRMTIRSNAAGFRSGRELGAPDDRPRVLVLGDSMVFGMGVEEEERTTERLEALAPGWRVENLGMIGFGPDLMLRALEAVGLDLRPAIVVLVLFSHDLYRVIPEAVGAGFPLPRFTLVDGHLETVPYPERPWWMRLHLVQGARYVWFRYTPAVFPLNAAILDRFRAHARSNGFAPAVVFAPGPVDGRDDRHRRAWLRGWAESAGVAFLDLTDAVAEAGGSALYIPDDAHWNPDGHALVARELHRLVAPLVP